MDLPATLQSWSPDWRDLLLHGARLASNLDGSRRLAVLLEAYVGHHPADGVAWIALVDLLQAASDHEAALEACQQALRGGGATDDLRLRQADILVEVGRRDAALDVLWDLAEEETAWEQALEAVEAVEGVSPRLLLLRARHRLQAGDPNAALEAYNAALAEDPRCVEALRAKARLLLGREDPEAALASIRDALEVTSTQADLWLLKARAETATGEDREALRSLEVALRYEPYNLEALARFGRLGQEAGRAEEAAEALGRALEIAPEREDLLEGWREASAALGRWEDVRAACRRLWQRDPTRWDARLEEALGWARAGEMEEARELLAAVVLGAPDVEVLRQAAEEASNLGLWSEALKACDRLLTLAPGDFDALRLKGVALKETGDDLQALRVLDLALKRRKDRGLLERKRDLLRARGPSKALVACCEELARMEPPSAHAYADWAHAARERGRTKQALRVCEEGLQRVPEGLALLVLKGDLLLELERPAEALQEYEAARQRGQGFEASKGRALCLSILRSYEEAETALQEALDLQEDPECRYHLGLVLRALDRPRDAVRALEQAVAMPGTAAWMAQGRTLLDLGRHPDALHAFEQVLERDPHAHEARLEKARCLGALDEQEAALQVLEEGLADGAPAGPFLRARITCLEELGRPEEAYEAAAALTEAEDDASAWSARARWATSLGRSTEALECLKHAAQLAPDDPEPKVEEARVLLLLEDPEGALQVCHEILRRYPGTPEAARLQGEALVALGREEDALHAFRTALSLSPEDVEAHRGRALALAGLGRTEEALEALEATEGRHPSDPWSFFRRAEVLMLSERWEDALHALNQSLYYGGSRPAFLAKKGVTLLHLDRGEEGLRLVEAALPQDGEDPGLLFAHARLVASLGRPEEALQDLEALLGTRPRHAEGWLLHAEASKRLGMREDALEALARALASPHPPRRVWIRAAELYRSLGQDGAALGCFDAALQANPRNVDLWMRRGRMAESLGRWPEAARSYAAAREIRPRDEEILCAEGRACVEAGHLDRAAEVYRAVLRVDPTSEAGLQGQRQVEERRRVHRVQAYAWRVLEFEAVNARPASKEEAFKYCNVPTDLLEDAMAYVNEPASMDVTSLSEGEWRRWEALSRDILASVPEAYGIPRTYQVLQHMPDLSLADARQGLEYVRGVLDLDASPEPSPGMEGFMKRALETPREEWDALSLARNLGIGAYQGKRLEGALHIFDASPSTAPRGRLEGEGREERAEGRCRRHGAAGIYQHLCGQYLCSACIAGGRCPVCHHPVSRAGAGRTDEEGAFGVG